jgi:hypothetical protein
MTRMRVFVVPIASMLFATACGGSDDSASTTTPLLQPQTPQPVGIEPIRYSQWCLPALIPRATFAREIAILTANGFEFVSNAPLPNAQCDSFPTLIESSDTQGVQLCGDQVGYLTLIPADTAGSVFASVEKPDPDVTSVGITSMIDVLDPGALPLISTSDLTC